MVPVSGSMNWVIIRIVLDFAGAVRPEEADHLPAIHLEGQLVHGRDAAEPFGYPVEGE